MSGTAEEIRAAEQKVIEGARMVAVLTNPATAVNLNSHSFLCEGLAELDALKSPMPSREQLKVDMEREGGELGHCPATGESWGAYWLRILAKQCEGEHNTVWAVNHSDLCQWADELEARS